MNQQETIEKVVALTEKEGKKLSKSDVESVLKNYGASVIEAVAEGGEIPLPGVGKFKGKVRAARTGRNPKTGEKMEFAATKVGSFSFGQTAKRTIAAED